LAGRKDKDEPASPLPSGPPVHPDDQPEQAGGGVTGPENLARQQEDPDLDDTSGGHP
jgi:hypothetical protein